MKEKPGILAKRAAYQYRRRDILAYASLRLYLRNHVSLRDRWAHEVATSLAVNQTRPVYNHILQFKQLDDSGKPNFRHIYMPGPNEIVAETALLAECADSPEAFQPPDGVYSYRLSTGTDIQGVFKYYLPEYRNRHRSIARACRQQPDAVVLYTDIRQFYPSVSIELAKNAWNLACQEGQLKSEFQILGTRILENYGNTTISGGQSLLIGPMFSHLIGNLVLKNVDKRMASEAPGRCFRYVDDFVFVATEEKANRLENDLQCMLNDLGLELNSQKTEKVVSTEWLEFERSFEDDKSQISWKTFIGKLKQLLLIRPESFKEIKSRFRDAGIRIHPIDYSQVLQDSDYLRRISALSSLSWFRQQLGKLTPERIIFEGLHLRYRYMRELEDTIIRYQRGNSFVMRMCVSRLRFLLSRLGYLAPIDSLHAFADEIDDIPEVAIYAASFRAIADHDVSKLLHFGPKAAQSVVQPLRVDSRPVRCSISSTEEAVTQAYSILQLNGVQLDSTEAIPESPMNKFCRGGEMGSLFESDNLYFRELACLHGLDDPDLLRWSLETAFDHDEEMVFDMIEYMYMSY